MSCGEIVSYIGSWASIVGIFLTFATLLIARSLSEHIVENRFQKRVTQIVAKMREYQKAGNQDQLKNEISILVSSIESTFGYTKILFSKRIRKLYFEARKQKQENTPSIQILEGLLANYKVLHAEAK